jgi:hypothetical protein
VVREQWRGGQSTIRVPRARSTLQERLWGYFVTRMAARNERQADNQRRYNAANERLGELVQERVSA